MLLYYVSLLPKASQNTKDEMNWPKRSYIEADERSPKSTPSTSLSCHQVSPKTRQSFSSSLHMNIGSAIHMQAYSSLLTSVWISLKQTRMLVSNKIIGRKYKNQYHKCDFHFWHQLQRLHQFLFQAFLGYTQNKSTYKGTLFYPTKIVCYFLSTS